MQQQANEINNHNESSTALQAMHNSLHSEVSDALALVGAQIERVLCCAHAARRASDRKRKETDRMAEFMQGTVSRTKRRRKQPEPKPPEPEPDRDADSRSAMTRGDAELAAAQLTHMPRSQWPADVFEYQQRVQREKKRASRRGRTSSTSRTTRRRRRQ